MLIGVELYKEGHAGLSLLLATPFVALLNFLSVDLASVLVCSILLVFLSSIPDLDQRVGIKHRGITHTILFGLIVGIILALTFGYIAGILYGVMGFIAGLGATLSHLLGDTFTYSAFKPFARAHS